jgi:hypothetical protein
MVNSFVRWLISTDSALRIRPLRRHSIKDTRESARGAPPSRVHAVSACAGVAVTTTTALAPSGVLSGAAAVASITTIVPRVGSIRTPVARAEIRGRGHRFRSPTAVHRDAFDGEAL